MTAAAQLLLILFLIGVDVGVSTGPKHSNNNNALIITNTVGLLLNAAWVTGAYWAVHEEKVRAAVGLMAALPITFAMPAVDIVLGMPTAFAPLNCYQQRFSSCGRLVFCSSVQADALPLWLADACNM